MIWNKKDIGKELVKELTQNYGCDALTASILVRRGIINGEDILFYLENDPRFFHNPFLFKNMEDAVDRILNAKDEGEKVLIFGDRDVDGITATTVLYEALIDMGLDAQWRVPSGDETYGLSNEVIDQFAEDYGTLIITVDCGISNMAEIAYAAEKGIDTIVVDHHTPQETLPPAAVIINHKIADCGYPQTDLSGCATAWKLAVALRFSRSELYKQEICLLTIVPENEAYTVHVLKLLNMVEIDRIAETIIPGMVRFDQTRLLAFLKGQQIFVWDGPLQKRLFEKAFGKNFELQYYDLQPDISKKFPQVSGMSLLRLKDLSRIGRYHKNKNDELDGFMNLFITYVQQTENLFTEREKRELQLVALSTIADLMELQGENRIIVKQGLAAMSTNPREGLKELLAKQKLLGKKLSTDDIGWQVSPLINATGRMGKPETAIELFLADTAEKRNEKANAIITMNEERKQLGAEGWDIAEPLARESLPRFSGNLAIGVSDKIHRGITGILSNRLANTLQVPVIVICILPDGTAIGSCRSARGYHLLALLEPSADLFYDYGGHNFAAGFSLAKEQLPELLHAFELYAAAMEFSEDGETEELIIDAELPHEYLTPKLLELADLFEPYGEKSPKLLFTASNIKILNVSALGKTEKVHLKLTLDCGTYKWPALYWNAVEKLNVDFAVGDSVDAVFTINRNSFNGTVTPQMIIQDMKRSAHA
ncbi:single-stranded-DNA-specific exonuclease RecJ [Treponema phagedenis]|uniref:single-stranded-DNA-specific exonuclease RecJ n=1 Tax=Treponema phagedenis TaxID=162 RepID=UPI0011EE3988|nr:single-stranded-DNA-specific exonuclease RecJ [Treponema phagedenis]TYT76385.1 single-stranded-DNA-specific exonuclease RecJ [Treponema phagedenis]TYT76601.1 single-stranded-DNA-specific exonuclease RecJ [Treponema phagedenis]